ncbi:5-hydroxytryptamine receptor-like [Ischnura elegans]|uniref:5-hydroxytryptamine receptor-like n=1 Tax=Ischnura elegans TaxID=197161 RepID=UPI001ED87A68|nr:5-hydroxytryptamine receptor-like [Ischnura elegans]
MERFLMSIPTAAVAFGPAPSAAAAAAAATAAAARFGIFPAAAALWPAVAAATAAAASGGTGVIIELDPPSANDSRLDPDDLSLEESEGSDSVRGVRPSDGRGSDGVTPWRIFIVGNGSDWAGGVLENATEGGGQNGSTVGGCGRDAGAEAAGAVVNGSAGGACGGAEEEGGQETGAQLAAMVGTALILGLLILATVIGNVFVIAAILLERNLQNVANYLILSLAVADLLVACLVMPLGAVYEVSKQWTLGPELCDMWTSSDVLCCTASILHLVAIAVDRYWAVTNIDYIHQRTGRRIGVMILTVWSAAFLVSIAPFFGWKDPDWENRIFKEKLCLVSQDVGYQIFATCSSFYVPLLVILLLYWRIFQTARKRIRKRRKVVGNPKGGGQVGTGPGPPGGMGTGIGGLVAGMSMGPSAGVGAGAAAAAALVVVGRPLPTISEATTTTTTTAFTNVSSANTSPEKTSFANGLQPDPPTQTDFGDVSPQVRGPHHHHHKPRRNKDSADTKRERKAAKTLAIITGAFVFCWLPFFIFAIVFPVCSSCNFNQYMISFFLWLGYFNSTLNPVIYTIFSPEFRHAFKRILCGRRSVRRRHFGVRYLQ